MATNKEIENFYKIYGPVVAEQCKGTGLHPEVILSQLIIESAYGTKLTARGNLGGRKILESKKQKGKEGVDYSITTTTEMLDSEKEINAFIKQQKALGYKIHSKPYKSGNQWAVRLDQPFEISGDGSPEANVRGQIAFLQKNPRYRKGGLFDAKTPEEAADILKTEGYATAADYAGKLKDIFNSKRFDDLYQVSGKNTSTNTSTSTPTKTKNLVYSVEKGGWISEDEYKVGQVDGSIMKKKPFGYNILSDEEKILYDKANGADITALTFDEKIFNSSKTLAFSSLGKDAQGNKLTGLNNLSDEQGSAMLAKNMQANFAKELGYDPENLSDAEKIHVSLYLDKFKEEFRKVKENDNRSNSYNTNTKIHSGVPTNIEAYLKEYGIEVGGKDPFIEDILDDNNFTETFNRNAINDYSPLLDAQKKVSNVNDFTGLSKEEIAAKIEDLKKKAMYDTTRTMDWNKKNAAQYNIQIEELQNYSNFVENNQEVYDNYQLEGSTKTETVQTEEESNIQTETNLPEIEEEEEVNNEILPSLKDTFKTLEDLKASDSFLNSSEEGQQQLIDGWNSTVKTKKFSGLLDDNTDTGLPEMTVQKGLLDSIGGISTIASALVGAKALKAANEPQAEIDMPELSDAFNAELYQQEQLSKRGFSPDQEAAARKQISDSYALGIENAVRGTAGDRAKLLAMSGVLDSKRQAALLDFAAKDDAAMQANKEQFNRTLMFKEKFDVNNAQQMRNEKMQEINNRYSTNQQLAASAFKYAMDNVNNAKADAMQNQLTQVLINDASAGYDVKEKYSSGLLGKFASSALPGLFGNNENNTETEQ